MAAAVDHVIVLMLENRSFDHMLGFLQGSYPPGRFRGVDGSQSNPDRRGTAVQVTPDASARLRKGPEHTHAGVMQQLTGVEAPPPAAQINNRGFVRSYEDVTGGDGSAIMQCFRPDQVPVLSTLAKSFCVCDNWFCSVPGETWPNRNYLHAATSDGEVNIVARPYHRTTIFERLEAAGAGDEWAVYHRGPAQVWAFPALWQVPFRRRSRFRRLDDLPADIREGRLPSYSFVEPDQGLLWPRHRSNSQHPSNNKGHGRDFYAGERLILDIYRALVSTPAVWNRTLFVVTYDEHGGFFDHHPPPDRGVPPSIPPDNKLRHDFAFDLLGPRVPTILISPFVGAGDVDDRVHDHSSIVTSLRERFAPAAAPLTARDAAARSIWQNLRLNAPRTDDIPDADVLAQQLDAVAIGVTGLPAGAGVQQDEQRPELDTFGQGLLRLTTRVDAALRSDPSDPAVIDRALRGAVAELGFETIGGISMIEAASDPRLIPAADLAEYVEDVERRFRET